MEKRSRTQLALGIILILVATWFVLMKNNTDVAKWFNQHFDWPMWVVASGGLILLIGLLVGAPGMAVPACIVAGIGGILYYCNAKPDWPAWSYMWALIPGFVGVGNILAGILGRDFKESARHGLNLIVMSTIMFLIFAAAFGGLDIFGKYKEYVLAGVLGLFGLWFIIRGLIRSKE
jgi:hypothetical protein